MALGNLSVSFPLSKVRWGSEQNSPRKTLRPVVHVHFALGILTSGICLSSLFSFPVLFLFFLLNKTLLCITGWLDTDCVVQPVLQFMAVSWP